MFHNGQWIEEQYLVLEKRATRRWIEYIVQDRISENLFLVKRFSDIVSCDKSAADRFVAQAKIWINLGECEELVAAYMVKEYDGIPHIFLEHIKGFSLATLFEAGSGKPLPEEQIISLMKQLSKGMKFIHKASLLEGTGSIVHGGLNPQAIFIQEGNAKISDLGLAWALRQSYSKTHQALFADEIPYLAPEQIKDPTLANEQTDIYAFGAIAYEAVTGAAPATVKKSRDPMDVVASRYVSPHLRNRSCPQWLEETILKCMASERENRFQSFDHIEAFLTDVAETEKVSDSEGGTRTPADASRVSRVRGVAKKESRRLNHYYLGVEHLMLGLLAEEESLVVSCLGDAITAEQLQSEIYAHLPKGEGPWYWNGIIKSPRYVRVMSLARKIKRQHGHERMLPQHILLAILDEGHSVAVRVLLEASVDVKAAAERLRRELKLQTSALFNQDLESPLGKHSRRVICNKYLPSVIPFLGRRDELQRAVSALTEDHRSVIIVGEAGVGKTAFIRELDCHLNQFFSQSESRYGGLYELKKEDFFGRVEDDEQKEAAFDDLLRSIIGAGGFLVIDGIEALLGMGLCSRSAVGNRIRVSVNSGELLIVATTNAAGLMSCEMESGEIISPFERINLPEPSRDEIYEILSAARDILEEDYPVDIENAALIAAVDLPYQLEALAFPAKGIQLLEEVCLRAILSAKPGEKVLIDSEKIADFINE